VVNSPDFDFALRCFSGKKVKILDCKNEL
jgi:hypothetical protein